MPRESDEVREKRSQIVYSIQTTGYIKGRKYANPRHFNGSVRSDVTKVIVLGDYPDVVRAYQRAGIPVVVGRLGEPMDELDNRAPLEAGEDTAPRSAPVVDNSSIEIPENFASLHWNEIRALSIELGGHPAKKSEAVEFLQGIVDARAKAQK